MYVEEDEIKKLKEEAGQAAAMVSLVAVSGDTDKVKKSTQLAALFSTQVGLQVRLG